MNLHRQHPRIVNRLKRAEGRIRNTIEMLEAERPCLEVAQQLHAIEKAIAQTKRTLIHDHIDQCLDAAVGSSAELEDFKEIAKYL